MPFENTENHNTKVGWVEIITGSMFSGKTEELIRRLRRAKYARMRTEIYKPIIDTRYSEEDVVSHDEKVITSTPVDAAGNILLLANNVDVIGIDEAQFFDEGLVDVCNQLANEGMRVIVAGLDMDFQGKPFGPIPKLMATAEQVTKVHAICMRCGSLAQYSYRKTKSKKLVLLGEQDEYEPLCRACFINARKE
ncbi:MAG: thymidine kinase [Bacteroidales bacterium]